MHSLQSWGGGGGGGVTPLNHHQCEASTWMMRRLSRDNGSYNQLQVERRESHRANQVDGDYYETMIDKGQWREFGQDKYTQGYTPTLYEKCHGIFNDHRGSGPRFIVSSERQYSIFKV